MAGASLPSRRISSTPSRLTRAASLGFVVALAARTAFASDPPVAPPAPPAPPPSASAAPGAPPAAPPIAVAKPGEDAAPTEAQKADARAHFNKGLTLLREEAWAPALAEFLKSREIYLTRAATNNAAISLRKLQRFDESLAMFESLLRDFPNIPPGEREAAQKSAVELRGLVGTVEIEGAEPGASIAIGGQDRGEYPPAVPLRVSAGSHVVRVFKEGFEPFETRVDVAGGQSARVAAKLKKLTDSGRLKVTERGGQSLDVVVDSVVVGQTPWEGSVAVGTHTVLLRGKTKTGTQPAAVPVRSHDVTALTLVAEDLEAALRVVPTPAGASVAVDAVTVGRGTWLGRLRTGAHKIEISADGFQPALKTVSLEKGALANVAVQLDRDPNAPFWRKPPRIALEASAGLAFVPSFGGDIAGRCTGSCSPSLGLGALGFGHGTYELGSGLGFGLSLGYLFATQSITGRATQFVPYPHNTTPPPQNGTADDSLRLSAFLGGAHLSYHFGDSIPVLLRLGAGAMVGQLRDERKGRFTASDMLPYDVYPVVDRQMPIYAYVSPEAKVGVRLGSHVDLSAGVTVLMLVAIKQPSWTSTIEAGPAAVPMGQRQSPDGLGTYRSEQLLGQFVFGVAPAVSLRYDF